MAVAQARQQVFSDVRHFFQFAEAQESAGAFDGMNRAEHSRQRIQILRIVLQANQIAIKAVKVLITLDQKILDDLTVAHRRRSFRR
jgi:hypothetical protein